ncbi:hypothetical protein [Curvivirga sp.]|uniref:hypothetical protein n=1 Tax=Curvivirga sp. TaxID=2856848 RepID=UPI003B5B7E96
MGKRIIFISYCYPPIKAPRSVQVSRLVKHLAVDLDIVCCGENVNGQTVVDTEVLGNGEQVRIHRVGRSKVTRIKERVLGKFFPKYLSKPDIHVCWAQEVVRYIVEKKLLSPEDILVTFSQPLSDHFIGYKLKQKIGCDWIMHFSDPWTQNPFMKFPDDAVLNWHKRKEEAFFKIADKIIFTSDEARDISLSNLNASIKDKAYSLPHILPDAIDCVSEEVTQRSIARYIGNFYGHRTPEPLFNAIEIMAAKNLEILKMWKFELYGNFEHMDVSPQTLYDKYPLASSYIEFKEEVSTKASLELMVKSNLLLIIDASASLSVFLPSKLIDYLGAGRPIFGITPKGTAANLIMQLGGRVADPSHAVEIANELEKVLEECKDWDRRNIWGDLSVRAKFKGENVAKRFKEITNIS